MANNYILTSKTLTACMPGKQRPVYRGILRDFGNKQVEVTARLIKRAPYPWYEEERQMKELGYPLVKSRKQAVEVRELSQEEKDAKAEASKERSVRRARQNVRWRIKAQMLDRLVTLTVRENMTDRAKLAAYWARFVRLLKDKSGGKELIYVAVVEEQKRGALHIHVAMKGRQDYNKLRGLWWIALGSRVSWSRGVPKCHGETPGNIDVNNGTKGKTRPRKLANYLGKYLDKAMHLVAPGAKRYWSPKGFVVPKVVFYLAADTLLDAMIEVSDKASAIAGYFCSPWKSPDWSCVFASSG